MKNPPYIGVTGFMTNTEVRDVFSGRTLQCIPPGRKAMVGILISDKTLRGEKNKYPKRYPDVSCIANIFMLGEQFFNVIHYHSGNENNAEYLKELIEITKYGGDLLHGIQLNNAWPDQEDLYLYRCRYPNVKIILQIGEGAIERIGDPTKNSIEEFSRLVVQKISEYNDIVDYVLFDKSGGTGTPLCPTWIIPIIKILQEKHPHIGMGVAGGLCADPDRLTLVRDIARVYSYISVDAEGGLRDKENDALVLERAREYLGAVSRLFYYL